MKNCLEEECNVYNDKRCCLGCNNIKSCVSSCDFARNTDEISDCAYMISE